MWREHMAGFLICVFCGAIGGATGTAALVYAPQLFTVAEKEYMTMPVAPGTPEVLKDVVASPHVITFKCFSPITKKALFTVHVFGTLEQKERTALLIPMDDGRKLFIQEMRGGQMVVIDKNGQWQNIKQEDVEKLFITALLEAEKCISFFGAIR